MVRRKQKDLSDKDFQKYFIKVNRKRWRLCRECRLCGVRKKLVYGAGALSPKILIIGEAPGPQENQKGLPFIGPAGEILRNILKKPRISLVKVSFITNMVACYPSDDGVRFRQPKPDEIEACSKRIDSLYEVIKPKIVVLLGNVALSSIDQKGITKARGWHKHYRFYNSFIFATYHPSYILRHGGESKKELMKEYQKDWIRIRKGLDKLSE